MRCLESFAAFVNPAPGFRSRIFFFGVQGERRPGCFLPGIFVIRLLFCDAESGKFGHNPCFTFQFSQCIITKQKKI